MKRKSSAAIFIFLSLLTSSGCQNRNEFLWQIGCYVFIAYCVLMVFTLALPKIHRMRWFQCLAECVETPVKYMAGFIILGGIFVAGVGLSKWSDSFGPGKLTLLFGAMILIAGANLWLWTKANTCEEKAVRLKVVLLTTSFGVSLVYIMCGAQLIG